MSLFGKPYVSQDLAKKENGLQYEVHAAVFNPFTGARIGTVLLGEHRDPKIAEYFAAHMEPKALVRWRYGCRYDCEMRELFND